MGLKSGRVTDRGGPQGTRSPKASAACDWQVIAPRVARRHAPADGSSTRGGSTSVRGRVRSLHMTKLQAASVFRAAARLGWDRQTDGSRHRFMPPIRRGVIIRKQTQRRKQSRPDSGWRRRTESRSIACCCVDSSERQRATFPHTWAALHPARRRSTLCQQHQ